MLGIINLIYKLYHFIADIQLRGDPTSLVPQLLLMRTHNHGSFQSVEITKLLYHMKTLEITATRSQKNILKLLKHKQRLSKLKTQISSWSQHEIEDLWNAGLCCRSPAF